MTLLGLPMPQLIRGDARALPLPDKSVDLIVTSPPYFGLRSYQDGGEHYETQIGSEPTPGEFLDALIKCTAEMVRVLKPSGSIWLNLGDKYSGAQAQNFGGVSRAGTSAKVWAQTNPKNTGIPNKSLMLLPERYRIRCVDDLGLIARAVVVWSKPNGLPESVTDRVRRSHEDWVHLTKSPRYFSAVDEIRENYAPGTAARYAAGYGVNSASAAGQTNNGVLRMDGGGPSATNPIGKLPGSVWEIPTQPLKVPAHLGVDHFAAFPMEWPRRLIQGWSPREVCTACGVGRQPVTDKVRTNGKRGPVSGAMFQPGQRIETADGKSHEFRTDVTITGYACACPDTAASVTPGVVLDPFSGTGTTALVATMLGRRGIGVDLSADYNRLARWRASDPKERARAAGKTPEQVAAIRPAAPGQESLFDGTGAA